MRPMSLTWASSRVGLLTVRMPSGRVPVGSNGITTGGNVLGGNVGRAPSASELATVSAAFGSISSRKYDLTTLTPGTDRDSTRIVPGAWLTQRSSQFVMVFSIELVGMRV